jgi:hypothetical protein
MVDLEKEVRQWSEAALAGRCADGAAAAELADHLWCEIERARSRGASDEQAFASATSSLGSRRELAAEFARNRTFAGRGCAIAAKLDDSKPGERKYLIAHAILWATVMLAAAVLMKAGGASSSSAFQWTILLVLIPGWIGSERILRRAMRVGRA